MGTLELVKEAGAVSGAMVAFGGFVLGMWWFIRRVVHIADAVDELVPNGGSSIKDQVTRIEEQLLAHIENHHHTPPTVDSHRQTTTTTTEASA